MYTGRIEIGHSYIVKEVDDQQTWCVVNMHSLFDRTMLKIVRVDVEKQCYNDISDKEFRKIVIEPMDICDWAFGNSKLDDNMPEYIKQFLEEGG